MDHKKTQPFETQLRLHYWMAIIAALLLKATNWFGGITFTWGALFLMGSFASDLSISDFHEITFIFATLFIVFTLSLFTCELVTAKTISTGSFQPSEITYRDMRLTTVNFIKLFSSLLQFAGFFSCLIVHILAWKSFYKILDAPTLIASLQTCLQNCCTTKQHTVSALQECTQTCFPEPNRSSRPNLQFALDTFHTLMILTCVLGIGCNLYIIIYCIVKKSLSLTRYHDEVLRRAMKNGLVDASQFDPREFLLQGVGEDLVVRHVGPLEVKRQNQDFIYYLFHHPKGMEMVMGLLKSEDTLKQQTAANMAGFWCDEPDMAKDGMELLSGLGEKLGMPGKVAEGAANSFKALAQAWRKEDTSPLLKVSVTRISRGRGGGIF